MYHLRLWHLSFPCNCLEFYNNPADNWKSRMLLWKPLRMLLEFTCRFQVDFAHQFAGISNCGHFFTRTHTRRHPHDSPLSRLKSCQLNTLFAIFYARMVELSPGLTGVKDLTRLMGECSERVWVVFYCKYVYYSYFKALTLNPWELATTRTTPTRSQRTATTERERERVSYKDVNVSGNCVRGQWGIRYVHNNENTFSFKLVISFILLLLRRNYRHQLQPRLVPCWTAHILLYLMKVCLPLCLCIVCVRATPTFYCI